MPAPPVKNKSIPTHDTRSFVGKIFFDKETKKKRFVMDHPEYYQHELNQFEIGDTITMKMSSRRPKRTEAQNRYMHLYFSLISLASGHTAEEIKSWAKGKFLAKGITEIFKEKVRKVKETSRLTIPEMIEFIARIEVHTGVPAPDPGPFKLSYTWEEYRKMKEKQKLEYSNLKAII